MPQALSDDRNQSVAAETEKILKLIALDWAQAPYSAMCKEFGIDDRRRFYHWRQTDLYRETLATMTEEHKKRLLDMPSTFHLRQYINYGMGLAIQRLIDILAAEKSSNKDVVAAARLTA